MGYDYRVNPDTGEYFFVDRITGEIREPVTVTVPRGSVVNDPQRQEIDRERKRKEQAVSQQRAYLRKLGSFFFLSLDNDFNEISPATAARLVYLATFLKYGTNVLYRTKRTKMKKEDLPEILGVSETTAFRFWKEVSPKYLQIDDTGYLHMETQIFRKGEIGAGRIAGYNKVYREKVCELYKNTPISKHKELGYIFAMLPFINIEYNLLCEPYDIYTKDIDDVEPLSLARFCECIGYDYSKVRRLLQTYANIKISVNGNEERFCAFVFDGASLEKAKICVNPHVLYSGSDPEKVKILTTFCL